MRYLSNSLPDSLQIISDKAFQSCTGFLTLTIPDSVTSIGDSAFYGCSGLTTISIGSLASSIDEYAFGLAGADATLTEVQCAVPVPPTINANVFSNRDLNSSSLIVASGSLSAYQVASVWSSFGTISGTLSVEDIEGLSSLFQIYPNPSNGILYLNNKFNLEFSNIEIYNLQGSKVKSFDTQNFNDQIDVSNLKTGIYIIQLNTKKGSISKHLILNE